MKKFILSALLVLSLPMLCHAAYFESKTGDAQPTVLYGKKSDGTIAAIQVDSTGRVATSYGLTYNVKSYAAKGDGVVLTDGAITNGLKVLTSASATFTSADVGKVIWINNAGGSRIDLVSTIVSINSATSVNINDAASATVSAAPIIYGTDDTTAIQNTINAIGTAKVGTLYAPKGIYIINGDYQNASAENAQLTFPSVLTSVNETYVGFKGDGGFPVNFANVLSTNASLGTVFFSTQVGSTGSQSILAGYNASNANHYTNVRTHFEDITFMTVQNQVETAIDLTLLGQSSSKNLNIQPAYFVWPIPVEPTGTTSYALKMMRNQHNVINYHDMLTVTGFYNGVYLTEHATVLNPFFRLCHFAFVNAVGGHTKKVIHPSIEKCVIGFEIITTDAAIDVEEADFENDVAGGHWYTTTYDIEDTANHYYGNFSWQIQGSGGVYSHDILKNGGSNIAFHEITQSGGLGQYGGWLGNGGTRLYTTYGNVGIGTSTTPVDKLYVWGNANNNTAATIVSQNISAGTGAVSAFNAFNDTNDSFAVGIGSSGNTLWPKTMIIGTAGTSTPMRIYTNGEGASGGAQPIWIAPGGYSATPTATFVSGNSGIGTTAPVSLLDVNRKLNVFSGGNVGIGSIAPGANLDVAGSIRSVAGGAAAENACWCTTPPKVLGYCTGVLGTCSACNYNGSGC